MLKATDCTCQDEVAKKAPPLTTPPARIAERLKYLYLSERARAETVVEQRQPQLIEQLVEGAITSTNYDEDLSRMFFQLMVPLDFKEAVRHAERLVLVVDSATSSFPWEMLLADEEPMIVRTMLVRQFATSRFRANVRGTVDRAALVIGDPSTARIGKVFPIRDPASPRGIDRLAGCRRGGGGGAGGAFGSRLSGEREDGPGRQRAHRHGGPVPTALPNHSHCRPRLVRTSRPGWLRRTGVVLSDGLVLSAAEIEQMEIIRKSCS